MVTLHPPRFASRFPLISWLKFAHSPLDFLTQCASSYGDIVELALPIGSVLLISHPDFLESLLVTQKDNFKKGRFFDVLRPLMGNGLITSERETWLRQRRIAQPAFHRSRIQSRAQVMVASTQRLMLGWHDGDLLDLEWEMTRLTMSILMQLLFGLEGGDEATIGKVLETCLKECTTRLQAFFQLPLGFPTPSNLRYKRALHQLDEVIRAILLRHRATHDGGNDFLSMLLQARNAGQMDDRQLRDEMVTFLIAGHETVALTLVWAWYLLSQSPDVEAKLQGELQRVLGERAPTGADIPSLRYTEMIVKETLRLYPISWLLARETVQEVEIGGYQIPAGRQVWATQWIVHRDPRYYENPLAFQPERWEREFNLDLPKYAYLPFGAGPRVCLGQHFALTELVLVLATLAQKFRFELVAEQRVGVHLQPAISPKYGMKMFLKAKI